MKRKEVRNEASCRAFSLSLSLTRARAHAQGARQADRRGKGAGRGHSSSPEGGEEVRPRRANARGLPAGSFCFCGPAWPVRARVWATPTLGIAHTLEHALAAVAHHPGPPRPRSGRGKGAQTHAQRCACLSVSKRTGRLALQGVNVNEARYEQGHARRRRAWEGGCRKRKAGVLLLGRGCRGEEEESASEKQGGTRPRRSLDLRLGHAQTPRLHSFVPLPPLLLSTTLRPPHPPWASP